MKKTVELSIALIDEKIERIQKNAKDLESKAKKLLEEKERYDEKIEKLQFEKQKLLKSESSIDPIDNLVNSNTSLASDVQNTLDQLDQIQSQSQ